jgi:hypothetical protein
MHQKHPPAKVAMAAPSVDASDPFADVGPEQAATIVSPARIVLIIHVLVRFDMWFLSSLKSYRLST